MQNNLKMSLVKTPDQNLFVNGQSSEPTPSVPSIIRALTIYGSNTVPKEMLKAVEEENAQLRLKLGDTEAERDLFKSQFHIFERENRELKARLNSLSPVFNGKHLLQLVSTLKSSN